MQSGGAAGGVASGPSRAHSLAWIAGLVALAVLTLALRLAGIGFLLPQNMESDGGVIVRQVALIEEGSDDPWREDCWSYYPHLVARTVALTTRAEDTEPRTLDEHLRTAAAPHVRVRTVVAWLALLALPATWWLARRFLGQPAAFLATAFVALSQLHLCFAEEARAHAPAAALATLAVAAALRLRARPSLANTLLAALAAGLALGTLQSGAAVLLPLALALVLRDEPERRSAFVRIGVVLLVVGACFAVLYPYTFAPKAAPDTPEVYVREDGNVQFFGHTVFLSMFNGQGFVTVGKALASFEPLLLALAITGVLVWLVRARRWSRDLAVVLAYVGPYLLVIGIYERTYERFVLQLVPFLACAAAWAFERLGTGTGARAGFRRVVGTAAAIVALLPMLAADLVLVTKRTTPDTAERAAEWITANARVDERVALLPFIDLPLARSEAALDDAKTLGWLSPWLNYQLRERQRLPPDGRFDLRTLPLGRAKQRDAALADPLGYLRASGARYYVVPAVGVMGGWEAPIALRNALVEHATLAVRIPALREISLATAPLDVGDSSAWERRNWVASLFGGRSTVGDVLEIYRLD